MIVKNQTSKLEKRFKTAKEILYITGSELLYKDEIYKDIKLINIQKEIELFCLQFYYIKNIVKDRFDNINRAITNSEGEIKLDFMKK